METNAPYEKMNENFENEQKRRPTIIRIDVQGFNQKHLVLSTFDKAFHFFPQQQQQ